MKITRKMLEDAGACQGEINRLVKLYGDEVDVDAAFCAAHPEINLREYAGAVLWRWAASHLLPRKLRAEFERQEVQLYAEYQRQEAPLWAAYQRQVAILFGKLLK